MGRTLVMNLISWYLFLYFRKGKFYIDIVDLEGVDCVVLQDGWMDGPEDALLLNVFKTE